MIFPDTETGRGAGGAGGQGEVAAVPAPLLRHRELQHDHQSVPVFFFFCSALRARAELSHLNGIILGSFFSFITNLITLQSAGAQQYFLKAA